MNYTLNAFDERYAQIQLNHGILPGKARRFDRVNDWGRKKTPPFIDRVLGFAGVWSVTVNGNIVGIELVCYCGLPWEIIARETAKAAAELLDRNCDLVQRVTNADFKDLFPFTFRHERIAA